MRVDISIVLRHAILAHAARDHPREACGLLLGDGRRIAAVAPAANVAADPLCAFEVDPAALLRAHRESRGQGTAVIGCYHSHPNGRADPSAVDAERVTAPGEIWLIAADGGLRAFVSGASGFAPAILGEN